MLDLDKEILVNCHDVFKTQYFLYPLEQTVEASLIKYLTHYTVS